MKSSLIVSTYNRPDALEMTLMSIQQQRVMPSEVIVADDGSGIETRELIQKYQHHFNNKLIHVWQEDQGYRLARIRNLAIARASFEYIISIDGDLILHPRFIASHLTHAREKQFAQGSRVLLSQRLTEKAIKNKKLNFYLWEAGIRNRFNAVHHMGLSKIFSGNIQHGRNTKGCNMAFWRDDAIAVNGFNEVFEGWGREDSEFVIRLLNHGVSRRNLRCSAVTYHLDHGNYNKNISFTNGKVYANDEVLQRAIDDNLTYCAKGLSRHLTIKSEHSNGN